MDLPFAFVSQKEDNPVITGATAGSSADSDVVVPTNETEQPPPESQTDTLGTTSAPGDQSEYSHMKEMARVEELGRMLTDIQNTLNKASMQCHLLNVDVVTQFDPHLHDMLKKSVEDCERCIANVTATDTEAQDLVNSQ